MVGDVRIAGVAGFREGVRDLIDGANDFGRVFTGAPEGPAPEVACLALDATLDPDIRDISRLPGGAGGVW